MGFFTDTSLCIGCKACEVACKEWNQVPESPQGFTGMSYDNTVDLGADTWRHVAFVEQRKPLARSARRRADGGLAQPPGGRRLRWLMASDVCKHCTHAACLEVCPTGALFRTEFGTVVVQEDICNGCGYCVPACPFGVLDKREEDGRVWKCTLCYDRLKDDKEPACAQACPTNSIQFGELDDAARARRRARSSSCTTAGAGASAQLYLADPDDGDRRRGRVLPAARRARGLRPAARPGRHDARPRRDLGAPAGAAARWRCGARDRRRRSLGGRASERAASYYGRPVIKEPVWTPEIPVYFFTGGLAGASAGLGVLAELRGNEVLARRAWAVALAGVAVSPVLLISDLGVPTRFLNMLRMFKVTSPMSVGSWILAGQRRDAPRSRPPTRSRGCFPRLARRRRRPRRCSGCRCRPTPAR